VRRKRVNERQTRSTQAVQNVETFAPTGEAAKSYRVLSVSLYSDQAELVDQTVEALLHAGFAKANRSLVIQTALQHLREHVQGKSPAEIVTYVLEHQGRRPLALARSRNRSAAPEAGSHRSARSLRRSVTWERSVRWPAGVAP